MAAWPASIWPVASVGGRRPVITQGFRPSGGTYRHYGVDIMYRRRAGESKKIPHGSGSYYLPTGIPAVASADGIVRWAYMSPKHGGQIGIEHRGKPNRVVTMYAHTTGVHVKAGQKVKKGHVLGYIGDSPSVRDPRHLHYEVRFYGKGRGPKGQVDPKSYLTGAGLSSASGASGVFNLLVLGGIGYGVYRLLKARGILK